MDRRIVRIATLDPEIFRGMLSVIDAVEQGGKPNSSTVREISLVLDRFTATNARHLSKCDPSTLEVIREAITTTRVPWFTIPKSRTLNEQHVWDFLRSLRKKSWSVGTLNKPARDALRNVFLFFIERLPVAERAFA